MFVSILHRAHKLTESILYKVVYSTLPNINDAAFLWKLSVTWPTKYMGHVGNKVKELSSKRMLQENKARQTSRKTKFFYPLIHTRTNS